MRSNSHRIFRSLTVERLFIDPKTCAKASYMVQYMQENGNPINGSRVPYVLEDLVDIALKHYVEEFQQKVGEIIFSSNGTRVVELRKAS